MQQHSLQLLIRQKLTDGRSRSTASLGSGAAPATGRRCDACEGIVTKDEFVIEGISLAEGRRPLHCTSNASTSGSASGAPCPPGPRPQPDSRGGAGRPCPMNGPQSTARPDDPAGTRFAISGRMENLDLRAGYSRWGVPCPVADPDCTSSSVTIGAQIVASGYEPRRPLDRDANHARLTAPRAPGGRPGESVAAIGVFLSCRQMAGAYHKSHAGGDPDLSTGSWSRGASATAFSLGAESWRCACLASRPGRAKTSPRMSRRFGPWATRCGAPRPMARWWAARHPGGTDGRLSRRVPNGPGMRRIRIDPRAFVFDAHGVGEAPAVRREVVANQVGGLGAHAR